MITRMPRLGILANALISMVAVFPIGSMSVAAQQFTFAKSSLVLHGVTVVDVEQGELYHHQRVVITGNRIQTVAPADRVSLPRGARVVEVQGKYVIPGLWDMHTHGSDNVHSYYPLFLASGITGVRELNTSVPLDTLRLWQKEILAGARPGPPRQLLSGPALDETRSCTRGRGGHTCITTGDTADARHVVDSLKTAGADMVKMYNLSGKMYFVVAAAARRAGLLIGGHASVPARAASDSGAVILDHSNGDLARSCIFGRTASIENCRPLAERFIRNNTWWVPTWVMPPQLAGRERTHAVYARLEEFARRFWVDSVPGSSFHEYLQRAIAGDYSPPPTPDPFAGFRQPPPQGGSTPDSAGYLYVVHHTGLPVMAGTDAAGALGPNGKGHPWKVPAGFSLHTELASYAAEGMPPLAALQTATLNPAKMLHATDSLGTVAPGNLADLVLLDANPLEDIINTTKVRAVVANGHYYDRAALDKLLRRARVAARKAP